MKLCPKCQRQWPEDGRFCPMDGAKLESADEAPTAPSAARLPQASPPAAAPSKRAEPAKAEEAETPAGATVVDMPKLELNVPGGAKARPAAAEPAKPAAKAPEPAKHAAKGHESGKGHDPAKAHEPAKPAPSKAEAAKAAAARAGEAKPGGKKPAPRFSETQWFMAGDAITNAEILPEEKDIELLGQDYERKEPLPEEVREQYSLADTFVAKKAVKPKAPEEKK